MLILKISHLHNYLHCFITFSIHKTRFSMKILLTPHYYKHMYNNAGYNNTESSHANQLMIWVIGYWLDRLNGTYIWNR